jgi:hypothetical protein
MSQERRRTTGTDDELRTLGEIAALAERLEFVTRELVILLTDHLNPEVVVELTRELNYEPMVDRAKRLIPLRLDDGAVPENFEGALENARAAMRTRNQFLHARWHWSILDPPGSPAGRYTHQRRTGEQLRADTTLGDLDAAADSLMFALQAVTILLHHVASELGAADVYMVRVYAADGPN